MLDVRQLCLSCADIRSIGDENGGPAACNEGRPKEKKSCSIGQPSFS